MANFNPIAILDFWKAIRLSDSGAGNYMATKTIMIGDCDLYQNHMPKPSQKYDIEMFDSWQNPITKSL